MKGYQPKNEDADLLAKANYERTYRKYQHLQQPTITAITTRVDLFPEQNAYHISGTYKLVNKTKQQIHSLLINMGNEMDIHHAVPINGSEKIQIKKPYQLIQL